MGTEAIKKLYTTGHGGIVQRATCHVETSAGSRARSSIVCTELPYQVNKATLLEKVRMDNIEKCTASMTSTDCHQGINAACNINATACGRQG